MKFIKLLIFCLLTNLTAQESFSIKKVLKANIQSTINPATFNYLNSAFKNAHKKNYDGILIQMNTPGGLVSTTKKILTLMGDSNIPVFVWIGPSGASATSAGAIISSGAHLIYMSSGTNIGAATPVQMGGDIPSNPKKDIEKKITGKDSTPKEIKEQTSSDLRAKAINDLVALVRSLSVAHHRDAEGFEKMISKASSFESQKALQLKLINDILEDEKALSEKLDGKIVYLKGKELKLDAKNIIIDKFEMDLGLSLLNIFASPELAYLLFLIGAALIYFELQAAGGFIAGSIGLICLILAGIGFQVLPLNFGALALIFASFLLFVLEIYITSYGILALLGIGSLLAGTLFLYRTNDAYIDISQTFMLSGTAAIMAFLGLIAYLFLKDHKNIGKTLFNTLTGKTGRVIAISDDYLQVKVGGEIWKANFISETQIGDKIKVLNQDKENLKLNITKD